MLSNLRRPGARPQQKPRIRGGGPTEQISLAPHHVAFQDRLAGYFFEEVLGVELVEPTLEAAGLDDELAELEVELVEIKVEAEEFELEDWDPSTGKSSGFDANTFGAS